MTQYSQYARATAILPGVGRQAQRQQKEKQQKEEEAATQQSLLRRAEACNAIAKLMVDQNDAMLAGLKAAAAARREIGGRDAPKVDFIARNMANVSPSRSGIGRKEQALLARAEVMAAATRFVDGSGTSKPPLRSVPVPAALAVHARGRAKEPFGVDSSAHLLAAARAEMERGFDISSLEAATRRPPAKLSGMGKGTPFPGAVTGSFLKDSRY